jgi:hypothetical protein
MTTLATCPFCGAVPDPEVRLPYGNPGEVTAYTCKTIHCPEWTRADGMQSPQCVEAEVARLTKERDDALALLGCYKMDKDDLKVAIQRLTTQRDAAREDASQFCDEAAQLKARIKRLQEAGDDLAKIIGPPGSIMWAEEPEVDRAYLAWTAAKEAKP